MYIWLYMPLNGESANIYYDWMGPSYRPFLKVCECLHDFHAYFHTVYIRNVFGPDTFVIG